MEPVHGVDHASFDDIFTAYTHHPALSDDQKALIREASEQAYRRLLNRFPNLHLFDTEETFRGRWDPSFSDWRMLGADGADDGFIPGSIAAGSWTLQVSIPVRLREPAALSIQIEGSESASAPVPEEKTVAFINPETETPSDELNWAIGELHEQSRRGQGAMSVQQTFEAYQQAGYHFLAIADPDMPPHTSLPHPPPITPIRSQEVETAFGHVLLLGTEERIPAYDEDGPLNTEEISQFAHLQGGLFCVAHPFALNAAGNGLSWRGEKMDWTKADLVEIWPGPWPQRFPEVMKAFDWWDGLLNRDIRIFGVCGKDDSEPMTGDRVEETAKTILLSEGNSETQLLSALKQGHFYSSIEAGISLRLDSEYGGALMGDELKIPENAPYIMHVEVTQLDRGGFLRVKSNEGIHCEMPISSVRYTHRKFFERAKPGVKWFRVEVYRYGRPLDELLGFTNPVFVRGMVSY